MPINIHGKSYNTVAERLISAHKDKRIISIQTEVLQHDPVVIKATVTIMNEDNTGAQIFTGISAANASKQIEKESPYEVAETSAVGRALAFAGYETTNGIASAEEMYKLTTPNALETKEVSKPVVSATLGTCAKCGAPMKLSAQGKAYCSAVCWKKELTDKVINDY